MSLMQDWPREYVLLRKVYYKQSNTKERCYKKRTLVLMSTSTVCSVISNAPFQSQSRIAMFNNSDN